MFNDFVYEKRYLIGSILVIAIVVGAGLIVWQKINFTKLTTVNEVDKLQQQNDQLRAQLSGGAQVAGVETSESIADKININTAEGAELDKISGVGPAIAQRIIDYRNKNGAFSTIEELKNVKGIGEATFEKMKNQITIGE